MQIIYLIREVNFKNILRTNTTQERKTKQPNLKIGRGTEQTFFQRRHTEEEPTGTLKGAQHHSSPGKCKSKPQ